ncbi:type II toxin-antitoxin system HicA family toxin [Clostridium tyrobutyricum]|uniref:type II toxin-antitoxin system HicA family toxin n=1 Tax=Clostridium tyrobutyricum TaxID=1519 RepID=UPI001C393D16|nr:type II toxin-antitoxin system HicA family toxin [Clostridium tyrobutyricum]MBV4428725.1 type II toxin-antitoxin system HicA family toxin [Clostridium tyrobutyricum]MBV4443866.1 type II toxin-antitoxin system HicA family toxin [Clostridium tyrobutyricum]
MKPLEIKLNREFKALQKQFEDYFFTEGHDKICDIADTIIRERYLKIHNMIDTAKKFYKNTDNKKLLETIDNTDILDKLEDEVNNLQEYINDGEDIRQKLMKDATEDTKEINNKIMELEAITYYNNMQKLSNQIDARMMQSLGRITFVLNTICDEVFSPYCNQVNLELDEISGILNTMQLKINKILEQYPEESKKSKIIKIFDYKKLNKLVQNNGYKEVRQTGDHKIFSNGQKSIPIPQHVIGLGLTQKIQKQI